MKHGHKSSEQEHHRECFADFRIVSHAQVSSVELEKACTAEVAELLEAAAVAVPSPGGGPSRLALFVVLRAGAAPGTTHLKQLCQQAIRSRLNPLFKVSTSPMPDARFHVDDVQRPPWYIPCT